MVEAATSDALDEALKALARSKGVVTTCNVLVSGKSGAGKSTLLNAVFGRELARTGMGESVTQETMLFCLPGAPLTITDTEGLLLADDRDRDAQVLAEIDRRALSADGTELHVAWYCVAATSSRFEDSEVSHLAALGRRLPVIVVVTQAYEADDSDVVQLCADILNRPDLQVRAAVAVLAKGRRVGDQTLGPHSVEQLVAETALALVDAGTRMAFVNAQRASLPAKLNEARRLLRNAVDALDGIAQRAAALWAHGIEPWSLRPVSEDLLQLLADLSVPFGGATERSQTLVAASRADLGGPTRAVENWLREAARTTDDIAAARLAVSRYGDAFLSVASDISRRELDGEAPDDAEIAQLIEHASSSWTPTPMP